MKASYWEIAQSGAVRCALCPHACLIPPGGHGRCRVRVNRGGVLELPFHGRLSSIAVDPIEKKPLYHFHPGKNILSVGFVGCSFRCPFCQNHRISQDTGVPTREVSTGELVAMAEQEGSFGIAYTYSEPLVHLEYVLEACRLARARGLKNVLVSNGFVNPQPAEELLGLLDAANIDLKSFNPEFYRQEIGGELEQVKRFLTQARGRIELEVTTLVIPGRNDGPEEMEAIAAFLAALDPAIPLHLSAYHPQYRYTLPPTPAATVRRLAEVARRYLRYVYLGNLGAQESNTVCRECAAVLVRRRGYQVSMPGLHDGRCAQCGTPAPIVGV
ncbi:MAG: AmmeMemoRadiSam system radical SAM enzyme [Spirochaetes bacterium RBG_16_67_19]|nr:MAG: AmmeMemoRadiSam system radical SAM enzyme [Spirochaetes bacterium RBG_16_67_19]